jgi:AraC family transcriptional regulator
MPPPLRLRVSTYAADLHQYPHTDNVVQISLLLRGRLRESVGRVDALALPLAVTVKDVGLRHEDRFGPEPVEIAQLAWDGGTMRDLVGPSGRAPVWRWGQSHAVARSFLRIVQRASPRVAPDDPDVVDLLAALVDDTAAIPRSTPPRWLVDSIERWEATWSAGTRVQDVARSAGVHPVYLARCVRRWYGCSTSDVLRQFRRRAAIASIAAGHATMSATAYQLGYADQAHFTHDVRQAFGVPPLELRRAVDRLRQSVAPIQGDRRTGR